MGTEIVRSAAELFGVMETPRNARDRLIYAAIDLFYRHGFNAVGIDHILRETGVTKTTFYKHFDSKDDLVIAAIEKRDAWETQAWKRAVREVAGDDPRKQLLAVPHVLHCWFNDPDFGGCQFINAAAEFPNPHDPVHEAAARHKINNRHLFRDLAAQAGAADPEAFADQYTLLIEGTLIMRQVHGRNDAAQYAQQMIEQLVTLHIPETPPPSPAPNPVTRRKARTLT